MGIKISELNEYTNPAEDDFLLIVDAENSKTKKITKSNLWKDGIIVSPSEPEENDRRKVWFKKKKNLFNKNSMLGIMYLLSDGEIKTSSVNFSLSDYISIEPNTNYTYQGLTNIGNEPCSAYYDKDKNFISSFRQAVGENTILTPQNACFIRFSINTTVQDEKTFQIEQGTEATEYEPYANPTIYIKNDNGIYEEFIKKEEEDSIPSFDGADLNTLFKEIKKTKTVYGHNFVNAPTIQWLAVTSFKLNATYEAQIAYRFSPATIYFRTCINGTWGDWTTK